MNIALSETVSGSGGDENDEIFSIFRDNSDQLHRLTNINSSEYLEQLAPIIKSALVSDDSLDDLVISLEDISHEKSRNLEQICKESENDILKSVTNISKIKASSAQLQGEISEISSILENNGSKLIEKKKKYLALKNNSNKINQSVDLINSSLQMLELSNKVHDLIKKEKFFIALKNLDDLKNVHLKNSDINQFKFSMQIYQSIPILTNLIKSKSFESVRKLMTHLDKNFINMGEVLFSYTEKLMEKWYQRINSNKNSDLNEILKEFSLNSPIELTIRLSDSSTKLNPLNNEYIKIPLNPIYDALLIYESIDELDDLRSKYLKELTTRKDRLFYQILKTNNTAAANTVANSSSFKDAGSIKEFLFKLSAFFIVDSIINKNTHFKLRAAEATANLWESVADKLIPVLASHIESVSNDNIDELVELKQTVGIFIKLMENYGFSIKKVYDEILILLFKKFQKILLNNFEEEFKISLYEDDSMPMRINDMTLYKKVLAVSWYQTDNPDVVPISPIDPPASGRHDPKSNEFPKHLPFSQLYPMTCAQVRSFVNKSLQFLEFNIYNKNYKLLSQLLISSLDELMSNKIGKHLKEKVNSTNREEIAQNLINLDFFYISSHEVSKLLTSFNAMVANNNPSSSSMSININLIKSLPQKNFILNSTQIFKEIKKNAENKLFEMVDGKVMQLMEMIDFDFETTITNNEPSMYIIELGEFLKAMFSSTFSNLPAQVLNLLIYRTFDILADNFKAVLKDSPLITDVSILNFDSDLSYIENILDELREEEDANNSSKLRGKFEELRQILLLLKNGSFEEFRNFKSEKYSKVDYDLGAQLLNKLRINGRTIGEIQSQFKPGSPDMGGYDHGSISGSENNGLTMPSVIKSPSSMNFSRFYKFRNPSK
ncbi:Rab GTPase-binding exocyst subunit [Saccharomycopsis crataegensis]|uniref:Exocyst complex component SEC15 n=1 Tax=Saccharomycopsis crataegensis TaxID=43959 RepID=A0AAV5QIC0_9ASCO|nr:Rab GTPase-binding exocyst subunit [Saccharomycopsis crataegensis]